MVCNIINLPCGIDIKKALKKQAKLNSKFAAVSLIVSAYVIYAEVRSFKTEQQIVYLNREIEKLKTEKEE